MVQVLAFLSKKSWHTKNLNNQEKVWIGEEQAKQETLKTSELAKQIQQEREEHELHQIAGSTTTKKLDRGMYNNHINDIMRSVVQNMMNQCMIYYYKLYVRKC